MAGFKVTRLGPPRVARNTIIVGGVVYEAADLAPLTVEDEGTPLATAASTLDFVGAGVTASGTGATKTITIPGGSGLTVEDEGTPLATDATTLDFVGAGVTASGAGATKTITIAGGSGITVEDEGSPLATSADTLDFVGAGVTATGSGTTKTITIPGGGGGAASYPLDDYLASSGSARNDEFDDGPGIDGKWTLTGTTPDDTDENNDYPDLLMLRRNDTGSQLSVYHQDLPSFPCDITARIPAASIGANFARGAGLVLTPTAPTTASAVFYFGWLWNSGKQISGVNYTSFSGFGSTAYAFNIAPGPDGIWVRITILTGTTFDAYWSIDGYFWNLALSGASLGFTVVRAGIGLAPEGQAADLFGLWSHYRVSA